MHSSHVSSFSSWVHQFSNMWMHLPLPNELWSFSYFSHFASWQSRNSRNSDTWAFLSLSLKSWIFLRWVPWTPHYCCSQRISSWQCKTGTQGPAGKWASRDLPSSWALAACTGGVDSAAWLIEKSNCQPFIAWSTSPATHSDLSETMALSSTVSSSMSCTSHRTPTLHAHTTHP